MKAAMRVFWLISLLIFTAGCSTYKVASLPRYDEQGSKDGRGKELAKVGDKVRIKFVENYEAHGRIQAVSAEGVTLHPLLADDGKPTKLPPLTIPAAKIEIVEQRKTSVTKTTLLGLGLGTIVGILALGAAMSSGI